MGPAKRRGGSSSALDGTGTTLSSGATGSTSRSSKSSSSRSKDRHSKNSDRYDLDDGGGNVSSSRSKRDRGGGGEGTSSRGGARSRILARASAASSKSNTSNHPLNNNNNSPNNPSSSFHPRRRKPLDPTLLARGMSARSLGARISSSKITTVSNEDMERDLRHMEAYGAACVAYAQQFFAYTNRALVSSGHYGPIPPNSHPAILGGSVGGGGSGGVSGEGGYGGGGEGYNGHGGDGYGINGAPLSPGQYGRGVHPSSAPSSSAPYQQQSNQQQHPHPFSMPVRIDPEEEKRIALLRRRIAASEAKREVLETEYESLTNHVTHEFKKLRNARRCMEGQVKLLQELCKKRSDVLALRRVRVAAVKDVLGALLYRGKLLEEGLDGVAAAAAAGGGDAMDVDQQQQQQQQQDSEKVGVVAEEPEDLLQAWDWIEAQLREAEVATMTLEIPNELRDVKPDLEVEKKNKMVSGSGATAHPDDVKSSPLTSSGTGNKNGKRSKGGGGGNTKSSFDGKYENEDLATMTTTTTTTMMRDGNGGDHGEEEPPTKKRRSRDDVNNDDPNNKSSKRSNSMDEDGISNLKEEDGETRSSSSSSSSSSLKKEDKKKNATADGTGATTSSSSTAKMEDVVIPWEARIIPRTPYNVPIYMSHLSSAPDKSAAFGCNEFMGAKAPSLSFLESILPSSVEPQMSNEEQELEVIRQEALFLSEELAKERERNKELQTQIIRGRKKNDEMCCMMGMLRTETEAVLNRHNIILEMPEARARAGELAAAAEEEDEIVDVDEDGGSVLDYDGEEGEIIEPHAAAGGEISQDDDGEIHEDDDVDDGEDQGSLGMDGAAGGGGAGASAPATPVPGESDSAEEGEIQEDDDDVVNDGDDEDDMEDEDEEEGEILEEDAQPLKEVIVRMSSGGGGGQGGSSSAAGKGSGGDEEEEDEEEEEGEIREDDWVGNRDESDEVQGGSQGGEGA